MIHTRFCLLSLLVVSLGGLAGCSSPVNKLDEQISDALENDNTIDVTEADALRVFVSQESKTLGDDKKTAALLTPDGKIDESALMAYIKRNRTYRKLAKDGKTPTVSLSGAVASSKPLRLKVYLEASGSMFPYDAPGGNGGLQTNTQRCANPVRCR